MAQSRLGGLGGRSALKLANPRAANFNDTRNAISVRSGKFVPSRASSGGGGGQGQVSEPRSNAEANAELAAMDSVNAGRQMDREALKQAKMQTEMMQQEKTTQLAQAARGESPEAQAGQQRGIEMRQQRDMEKEKQRFKSTAELMGTVGQREPDKMGNINFEQSDMALLNDMVPDLNMGDYMDRKTGKMVPMFARIEQSGEPGSQEQVLAFYAMPPKGEEGMPTPLMNKDGPVRVNTKAAQQLANIWKMDQEERTGFPGTQRKAAMETAEIAKTRGEAVKAVGEGQYAAMGKPSGKNAALELSGKERAGAMIDMQKQLSTLREEAAYYEENNQPVPAAVREGINSLSKEYQRIAALPVEGSRQAPGGAASAQQAPTAPPSALMALQNNPSEEMLQMFEAKYGYVPADLVGPAARGAITTP